MGTYHINEGTFEAADEWGDQSLNIFTATEDLAEGGNLVISRDLISKGEDLEAYVSRQWKEMEKALPQMRLLRREPTTLGGAPATNVEINWLGENGTLRQRLICAVHNGRALVLTLTVPERLYEKRAGMLDPVLASFSFRQP